MFAVSASAANVSWTREMDAVWSTWENWAGGLPVTTDLSVFDARAAANLNTTDAAEISMQDLKIATQTGLITIGGANTLTLGAGGFSMNNDTLGLAMEAVVAIAVEQARNEASMQKLAVKGGAVVNLNRIGMGDLTLSGANMFAATKVIEDEPLNVPASLKRTKVGKLAFTEFGLMSTGAVPRTSPRLEPVRFNNVSGVAQSASREGRRTVKITVRGAGKAGSVVRPADSGGTGEDFRAALELPHGAGPLLAQIRAVEMSLRDTGSGNTDARDLALDEGNIVTAGNQNFGHQYATSRLTPQVSPPASGLLSVSFTFGYGFRMENANGSGPGAISNNWNHVNAYPMPNTTLQFNDIPPPPAPALHSESYFLNGSNRGNNTFRFANGHMVRNIGWDKNNLNTLLSDGTFLTTPMTFSYDDPATIGAFAHNGSYGSGPVIEAGTATQPYNQRQLRWTASGDSGGSISYFEFGNIPVDRLGGLYSVYLQGSGFVVPQLTNLTSPTLRLQTPGKAGTLILSYIQFVAVPTTIYWTGASTPADALWSNSNNLSTDSAGLLPLTVPLANFHSVVFNAAIAVNFQNTTLGSDQTIQALKFGSNATTPVSIGGNNTLTIVPTLPTTGVTVETLSANHTISTKIALGAAQTWTVTDASQILNASSVISGGFALTKAGLGTLVLTNSNTYTGATTINAGTLQLGDGGTTGAISKDSSVVISGTGTLAINRGNTMTQGVDFGLIDGSGRFTQSGNGTTILNLPNTYTGQTTVNGGVLLVTGVGSISGSTTVVNGGGTLGGTGTTGSVTVNGGVIAPGDPSAPGGIGDMTVNGNVSFSGSSALNIQFDYDIPAKDLLNLNGTGILTISSGAVLNFSVSVSDAVEIATPYIGTPLTIIDYADGGWTSTGPGNNMFAGMNDDQTFIAPSGFTYLISYDGAGGVSEVTLTLVSIPEPGAAVSLLGGLGLLLGVRRRRE